MSVGVLVSIFGVGALGAVVAPVLGPVAGAAVSPTGAFRGELFCAGAVVCAAAVAATAPNEAISKEIHVTLWYLGSGSQRCL